MGGKDLPTEQAEVLNIILMLYLYIYLQYYSVVQLHTQWTWW